MPIVSSTHSSAAQVIRATKAVPSLGHSFHKHQPKSTREWVRLRWNAHCRENSASVISLRLLKIPVRWMMWISGFSEANRWRWEQLRSFSAADVLKSLKQQGWDLSQRNFAVKFLFFLENLVNLENFMHTYTLYPPPSPPTFSLPTLFPTLSFLTHWV